MYITLGYVIEEINRTQSAHKRIYFRVLFKVWNFYLRESTQAEETNVDN